MTTTMKKKNILFSITFAILIIATLTTSTYSNPITISTNIVQNNDASALISDVLNGDGGDGNTSTTTTAAPPRALIRRTSSATMEVLDRELFNLLGQC